MPNKNNNSILEELYEAIVSGDDLPHIPHSSVFYAQRAYFDHSGEWVSLDRMERAMYLERMLPRNSVLDPDRKRDWE